MSTKKTTNAVKVLIDNEGKPVGEPIPANVEPAPKAANITVKPAEVPSPSATKTTAQKEQKVEQKPQQDSTTTPNAAPEQKPAVKQKESEALTKADLEAIFQKARKEAGSHSSAPTQPINIITQEKPSINDKLIDAAITVGTVGACVVVGYGAYKLAQWCFGDSND